MWGAPCGTTFSSTVFPPVWTVRRVPRCFSLYCSCVCNWASFHVYFLFCALFIQILLPIFLLDRSPSSYWFVGVIYVSILRQLVFCLKRRYKYFLLVIYSLTLSLTFLRMHTFSVLVVKLIRILLFGFLLLDHTWKCLPHSEISKESSLAYLLYFHGFIFHM